jgi:alpha-1,2-mannosyltransferase
VQSSAWSLGYREAKAIALIIAVVLWTIAAVFWIGGTGYRSIAGPLKGGDFVQFYAMGAVVAGDPRTNLYDIKRLHAVQTALVPESDPELYLPVYPPQSWLVFVPFTALPYGVAAAVWTLILVGGYAGMVRASWHTLSADLPDGRFVAFAAAAFPPFWNLVVNGQNTIIPLLAFFLAWRAIENNRRVVAGLALGLLFFKPQFGLALAVVVLAGGEWAMLAGLAAAAAVHVGIVAATTGMSSLVDYVAFMREVTAVEYLIEPDPFELHSIRSLARLASDGLAAPLWLIGSAVVLERTVRVWRSGADVLVRLGVLLLATVLVSPHLFAYDAAVLSLALLWIGAWVQRTRAMIPQAADRFWRGVPLLYATFLFPIAHIIKVQVSVLVMIWLVFMLTSAVRTATAARDPAAVPHPSTRPGLG